jgi:DNA-directed RNA polymerase subunit RPC12/RpoP
MEPQVACSKCKQSISAQDYFCPNCGKKIKDKPLSTTIARQFLVYILSISLPPLGLWPAVGYLKQKDEKSRMIGFIAIALTLISAGVTIWLTLTFMSTFNQQLNQQLNGSLNLYGY